MHGLTASPYFGEGYLAAVFAHIYRATTIKVILFKSKTIIEWSLWGEHESGKAGIKTQAMVSDISTI